MWMLIGAVLLVPVTLAFALLVFAVLCGVSVFFQTLIDALIEESND